MHTISGFQELNLKQYNPNFEGNRGANVKLAGDKRLNRQTVRVNNAELALITKARNQVKYDRGMGIPRKSVMHYMRDAVLAQMEILVNGGQPIRPVKDRSRELEKREVTDVIEMFDQLQPVDDVAGLLNEVLGDFVEEGV